MTTFGSVRTTMIPQSQNWAPVVQIFWPFTTQSSPSLTAVARSPARSEPAEGSLKSWHQISSPVSSFGIQRCLLLRRAVGHDRGRAHAVADAEDVGRRPELRFLLVPDHALDRGRAAAAVLLRPGDAGPAGVGLLLLPLLGSAERRVVDALAEVDSPRRRRTSCRSALASSQARASARKAASSGVSLKSMCSPRIASRRRGWVSKISRRAQAACSASSRVISFSRQLAGLPRTTEVHVARR